MRCIGVNVFKTYIKLLVKCSLKDPTSTTVRIFIFTLLAMFAPLFPALMYFRNLPLTGPEASLRVGGRRLYGIHEGNTAIQQISIAMLHISKRPDVYRKNVYI